MRFTLQCGVLIMPKFTKGPWVMDSRNESLKGSDGYSITVWGSGLSHGSRTDERVANAHLIASAPDMYKLLESISLEARSFVDRGGKATTWLRDAELLLAKARGES